MRTDYELVRRIMLNAADATEPFEIECLVNSGASRRKVGRHVRDLVDDGFLRAGFVAADDDPYYGVTVAGVTTEGRSFAQSVRSDGTWDEVKARMAEVAGSVATPVLSRLVEAVVLGRLGL